MKLNYRRTIFIGLAFLSISAFWQMYDNIIPLILKDTFALGETVTGMIMAGDNVLAIFLLPVFGSLSDRTETRMGKRMPFVISGTVLAAVSLLVLGLADRQANLVFFVGTLLVLLLAMGSYRSPAVALMPDLTPNHLRSKGNAIINLMGAVGGVYTLVMIKVLVGTEAPVNYLPLFISIVAVMIIGVGILYLTVKEKQAALKVREEIAAYERQSGGRLPADPVPAAESEAGSRAEAGSKTEVGNKAEAGSKTETVSKAEAGSKTETGSKAEAGSKTETGSKDEVRSRAEAGNGADSKDAAGRSRGIRAMDQAVRRSMMFLLGAIFLWFTAYNAVTTAFSRYAGEVWQLTGGGFADCLLVATVAAIISYVPIGYIASRVGRKKTILTGIILMTVCYILAALMGNYHPVMNVFFAVIGVGWAAINVNSYPMIVEMSKGYEIGKFTGTYYVFSMAAQIFTPIFSGLLLENISYRTLFPYAAVFSALAFAAMLTVNHGDSKPFNKGTLAHFDAED